MSKDTNRVLGHGAEADGIEEYDNPLPDWWLGMFIGTIIWAAVYTVHYHFIAHRTPAKALAAEMAEARERWPEATRPAGIATGKDAVAAGEVVYKANCTGCHGEALQGGIGPSLVDSVHVTPTNSSGSFTSALLWHSVTGLPNARLSRGAPGAPQLHALVRHPLETEKKR